MHLETVVVAILVGVALGRPQGFQDQFAGPGLVGQGGGGGGSSRFSSSGLGGFSSAAATTPRPLVPIIRHINRVNNDGSYTFGYESGDGTFRVETRGLDGIIKGKYGYVDENGQRKEVDYQAGSATGYEPSGQGITVPPRPPPRPPGQEFLDYDDGSGTTPRPRTRVRVQQQAQSFQPIAQPVPISRPVPQSFASALPPQPPPPVQSFQPIAPPPPQQSFRPSSHRQSASSVGGPSPIEQFLRQQLSGPGAQQVF